MLSVGQHKQNTLCTRVSDLLEFHKTAGSLAAGYYFTKAYKVTNNIAWLTTGSKYLQYIGLCNKWKLKTPFNGEQVYWWVV